MAENCDCKKIVLEEFARIVSETVEAQFDMLAIGVVVVNKDGNVSTKYAYDAGGKFPLLGGMVFIQDNLVNTIQNKDENKIVVNVKNNKG